MNFRTTAIIVAIAVLVGCTPQKGLISIQRSTPPSSSTTWHRCADNAQKSCLIDVSASVSGGTCSNISLTVTEYVTIEGSGASPKHERLRWKLPPEFKFCPRYGDGVFLHNSRLTKKPFDASASPQCSDEHEWKIDQREIDVGGEYEYLIRFRYVGGTEDVKCEFDPWIRNG